VERGEDEEDIIVEARFEVQVRGPASFVLENPQLIDRVSCAGVSSVRANKAGDKHVAIHTIVMFHDGPTSQFCLPRIILEWEKAEALRHP
jgi:hypothetical protein